MNGAGFYLGTHMPHWLADSEYPLFVAYHRLAERKRMPRAATRWALDSGGFGMLQHHGEWLITAREYAAGVRRCADEIGLLDWAAPQDWMCEPAIIKGGTYGGQRFVGTHLSVDEHQRLTLGNGCDLRDVAPELPWIWVVQGHRLKDYLRHLDMHDKAGINLRAEPLVGLGSVCRRQNRREIAALVGALADEGLRLHGFGVKTLGLAVYAHDLASADSLAWSTRGRRVPGCAPGHKTEANCRRFATAWRKKVLAGIPAVQQMRLTMPGSAA